MLALQNLFSILVITVISLATPIFSIEEREKYGEASESYATGRANFYPEIVMEAMQPFLKPSNLILDVATGTGLGARYLCQHGYKNVIGIDYDAEMLEQAEQGNTNECKVRYLLADVRQRLPFSEDYFDVITTFNALHQFATPKAMEEIARVLKPQGTFIIVTKNQFDDPIKREVQKILTENGGKKKTTNKLDTFSFLKENGFVVIDQKPLVFELSYGRDKYLNYALFASSDWNKFRNTPKGEEIIKKVNLYLDTIVDSKGKIKEKREILVIAAKKK